MRGAGCPSVVKLAGMLCGDQASLSVLILFFSNVLPSRGNMSPSGDSLQPQQIANSYFRRLILLFSNVLFLLPLSSRRSISWCSYLSPQEPEPRNCTHLPGPGLRGKCLHARIPIILAGCLVAQMEDSLGGVDFLLWSEGN